MVLDKIVASYLVMGSLVKSEYFDSISRVEVTQKGTLFVTGRCVDGVSRSMRFKPSKFEDEFKVSLAETPIAQVLLKLRKEKETNVFTDPRDGQTYKTIQLNGQTWMAQNLNFAVEDSWCYNDDPKNGEKYGRLYTWEAAKKACPPGWRLPTDEEWWELASTFGAVYGVSSVDIKAAYQALMVEGESGFSAQLGGSRSPTGSFSLFGIGGLYWSATEYATVNAWSYYFSRDSGKLYRSYFNEGWALSCRCVQDC